jgi:excisionase family DNA binding protein
MINEREQTTREYVLPQTTREYFVDATEAARFLGLNRRTLLKMAREGVVPAHPLGEGARKMWRFLLSELDEWLRMRVHSGRRPCSPLRRDVR